MRENIVRITTHDTKKVYEFPAKKGEKIPNLWEIEMKISSINCYGNADFKFHFTQRNIYLEEETLKSHGLIGEVRDKDNKVIVPPKEVADLILELLEIVGIYPCQE